MMRDLLMCGMRRKSRSREKEKCIQIDKDEKAKKKKTVLPIFSCETNTKDITDKRRFFTWNMEHGASINVLSIK